MFIACWLAAIMTFSQLTFTIDEDTGAVQPQVILTNPSSVSITIEVFNTDGSATEGVDYHYGPYTVTFAAGVTTAVFSIPITNDNILEYREDFLLTINSSSLPSDVTVGDPGEAIVTIANDDCKLYSVSLF